MRTTASTSSVTNTSAAAAARGMCRVSHVTTGESTAARMPAVITGTAIVLTAARNTTAPTTRTTTPTSSHAIIPRSRSHEGGSNMPRSASVGLPGVGTLLIPS